MKIKFDKITIIWLIISAIILTGVGLIFYYSYQIENFDGLDDDVYLLENTSSSDYPCSRHCCFGTDILPPHLKLKDDFPFSGKYKKSSTNCINTNGSCGCRCIPIKS